MRALCSAHIAVVNRVIRPYRLSTYDYFAYEVSPWDVPIWFVVPHGGPLLRVSMFDYADWDFKPHMFKGNAESEYELIDLDAFRSSLEAESGEGEIELLDALNFMERGDYSGAVRRVATALEAVVEAALKRELQKLYPEAEVVKKLEASKNDYPGRVRQYQKLSLRQLPEFLDREMDATRDLRHRIVHRAYRIPFAERGQAQRSVDTGRWIYNWFEESPERNAVREKKVALRSLGRNLPVFDATITQSGVIVHGFGEI